MELRLTLKNAIGKPDEFVQAMTGVKDAVTDGESTIRRVKHQNVIFSDFAGDYDTLGAQARKVFGGTYDVQCPKQPVTDNAGVSRREVIIDFGVRLAA